MENLSSNLNAEGASPAAADPNQPGVENPQHYVERSKDTLNQTLVHAFQCRSDADCRLRECEQMKRQWLHRLKCELRASGDCRICNQQKALLFYHIRHCREVCTVPGCTSAKAKMEEHQMQRRRQRMRLMLNNMPLR